MAIKGVPFEYPDDLTLQRKVRRKRGGNILWEDMDMATV